MSEKALLWLTLLVAAAGLYVSYQTAMGLQGAADKIKRPLDMLGL